MTRMTFSEWMRKVDEILNRKCGLDSRDLPDVCYRDMYDDGMSPRSAASKALRAADFY